MLTEERFLQLILLHVFGLIIRHRFDEGVGDGGGGCCLEDPDSSSVVDYSFFLFSIKLLAFNIANSMLKWKSLKYN